MSGWLQLRKRDGWSGSVSLLDHQYRTLQSVRRSLQPLRLRRLSSLVGFAIETRSGLPM